jgi:hypothetical protein
MATESGANEVTTYRICLEFESPLNQQWVSPESLNKTTAQWSRIEKLYRRGNSIYIPRTLFALDKRVKDEIAGSWQDGSFRPARALIEEKTRPAAGCIVVVMESPHFYEYRLASDMTLEPLAPLNKPESRDKFDEHIKRLVPEILTNSQSRTHIVLCNPVPLQTSLAHLMKAEFQESVQGLVRNCVWVALYQDEYEYDFLNRLEFYEPQAVINACTSNLKGKVGKTLAAWASLPSSKEVALWTCNKHPSVWNGSTKITRETSAVRP